MSTSTQMSLLIGMVALGFVVAMGFVVHDCGEQRKCEGRGGIVEEYDCHMQLVYCGKGCLVPRQVCDWRCHMPEVER